MLAGHDHHYVQLIWFVASAFGIAALVVLALVYRRAARRHELEQAEQIIADHDQLESRNACAPDRDRGPRL
jgi:hypothetical protein